MHVLFQERISGPFLWYSQASFMCSEAAFAAQPWKWLSKYSIISKISSSQIAWELDVITQMAWISLQTFMLLVIDNVITLQYY